MIAHVEIMRFESAALAGSRDDDVAVELPLEIRIEGKPVAVVMRTPGQDQELVAGWLLSEGVIQSANDIAELIVPPKSKDEDGDRVDVVMSNPEKFRPEKFTRHVFSSSSCGVCGSVVLDEVLNRGVPLKDGVQVGAKILHTLPACLLAHQPVFKRTGGIHACGLFDAEGQLLLVREDVGRHNALDKLAGRMLMDGKLPLRGRVLLLSGRVSFEMMQKAFISGIPIVAAVGAPSSFAVELAQRTGQTLVAFLRDQSLNVYSGHHRIS